MKLTRLYTNRPDVFTPIDFNSGLSVIVAEIRLPENRNLDTHNLGKTTVGDLIDFGLLKGKSPAFFLFKHADVFSDFTLYLEMKIGVDSFVTVGRPVDPGSRVSLIHTSSAVRDASLLGQEDWDHLDLPFDRAKLLLDGYLGFRELSPWDYRMLVGYLIRAQSDYGDVFKLGKYSGKHVYWKPFVAHLMGMSSEPVTELYEKREKLVASENHLASLSHEWQLGESDSSVLDGLISVKRREIQATTRTLDTFNFADEDERVNNDLVENLEEEISYLNERMYTLTNLNKRLQESLDSDKIVFRTRDAERLFAEAGVLLGEQIVKDYTQLIAFNRAITKERREELQTQLAEVGSEVASIEARLPELQQKRSESLQFLRESESLTKYKDLSRELTERQTELNTLENKRSAAARIAELRRENRLLSEDFNRAQNNVEDEIAELSRDESSRFATLRRYFTEIIHRVLGQNAILAIGMNSKGGLEFSADFVGDTGLATSGDKGTSYRKLLCMAFDLAMLRSHLDVPFPRFVFHDGALEQLEPRKRANLLEVLREYADLGLQPIITALDGDLPGSDDPSRASVSGDEVVLRLHDEGVEGRLFRMASW